MYFQPNIFALLPLPPPDWPNIVVLGVPALGIIVLVSMVFLFANSFLIRPASPIVIGTIGIRLPALPSVSWIQLLTVLALSTALLRWRSDWIQLQEGLVQAQAERDEVVARLAALREQQVADNKQRDAENQAEIARLVDERDAAMDSDTEKSVLLVEQAGMIARVEAEKQDMEERAQRNSAALKVRLVKVEADYRAEIAQLKEAHEATVSSLEAHLEVAISSQCGSCAAKDEDIEQLRVGMKEIKEHAENDKRTLNAEKDALMCNLAASRAETTAQQAANEELKDKHFDETTSLHARIHAAEFNEDVQRTRAEDTEMRLEEATASHASEIRAISTTLDQLRGDLDAAHANGASDKLLLETLERDLCASRAEVAAGLVVNTKLREKYATLQAHASAVEADRDAQHARAETAEAKLDEALSSYQAAHDELLISQDENSTLSASIDRLREDLEAAKTEVTTGLVANTKLREKYDTLQAHASTVEVDWEAQHVRAEAAEAKLDEVFASYQTVCSDLRLSQDENATLSASIDRLREDLEEAKTDGEAKDAIITSQEARIEALEESDTLQAAVIEEQRDRREEDMATISEQRTKIEALGETIESLECDGKEDEARHAREKHELEVALAEMEEEMKVAKENTYMEKELWKAHLYEITEDLESARRHAESCRVMNEQLESALGDRDATIASLMSKIETAEDVREQLSCLETENEELRAAHREESEGSLHTHAEFEAMTREKDKTISRQAMELQQKVRELEARDERIADLEKEAVAAAAHVCPSLVPAAQIPSVPIAETADHRALVDEITNLKGKVARRDKRLARAKADIQKYESDLKLKDAMLKRKDKLLNPEASTTTPETTSAGPDAVNALLSPPPSSSPWAKGRIVDWTPPFTESRVPQPPCSPVPIRGSRMPAFLMSVNGSDNPTEDVPAPPLLPKIMLSSPPGSATVRGNVLEWSALPHSTSDAATGFELTESVFGPHRPAASSSSAPSTLTPTSTPGKTIPDACTPLGPMIMVTTPGSSWMEGNVTSWTPVPSPSQPIDISDFDMPATPSRPGKSSSPLTTSPLKTSSPRPPTPVPASHSPRQPVTTTSPQSPRPPTPPPWAKSSRPTTTRAVQRTGGKENVLLGKKVVPKALKTLSGRPPPLPRASPVAVPQPTSIRSSTGKARKSADPPAATRAKGKVPVKPSSSVKPVPVRGPALRIPLVPAPAPSRSRK